jgi:hypothetical protein
VLPALDQWGKSPPNESACLEVCDLTLETLTHFKADFAVLDCDGNQESIVFILSTKTPLFRSAQRDLLNGLALEGIKNPNLKLNALLNLKQLLDELGLFASGEPADFVYDG